LEYLLEFVPMKQLLRIGGRSKSENEKLQECNIRNRRQPNGLERVEFAKAKDEQQVLLRRLEKVSKAMSKTNPGKDFLSVLFGDNFPKLAQVPGVRNNMIGVKH